MALLTFWAGTSSAKQLRRGARALEFPIKRKGFIERRGRYNGPLVRCHGTAKSSLLPLHGWSRYVRFRVSGARYVSHGRNRGARKVRNGEADSTRAVASPGGHGSARPCHCCSRHGWSSGRLCFLRWRRLGWVLHAAFACGGSFFLLHKGKALRRRDRAIRAGSGACARGVGTRPRGLRLRGPRSLPAGRPSSEWGRGNGAGSRHWAVRGEPLSGYKGGR